MSDQVYRYEKIEIPNSSVLDSADQFYNGAEVLRLLPPMSGVLLPMVTNAALALELYIKSLCVRSVIKDYKHFGNEVYGGRVSEEPLKRSHDLSSLLGSISNDVKEKINVLHANEEVQYSFSDLVKLVMPYDKLFVEVRYSYENDVLSNINITELFHCLSALRSVIQKITRIEKVWV